ncbi:hypothetical protein CW714_06775 [Methanophagales archaeon]|nr:MAG: hypothetical protein CW714_06775 [Methanophagales archaeon]
MNKMEKDKRRKIIVGGLSIIVTTGLIAYLTTLPGPEKPYWYYFGPLLFLYWIIFITWSPNIKRKSKVP